jgi:LacI family repressor for deo operon, udp, cdd, tsx, nupC, and nupG
MNYAANTAARSLRVGVTRMFLVLLPKIQGGQSMTLVLAGIDEALTSRGYGIIVGHFDRIDTTERRHLHQLARGGLVDGAIVIAPHLPGADDTALQQIGLPLVSLLMDRSGIGIPSVITDDRSATRNLVRHLLQRGHSRFLYVSGPKGNYHEIERSAGVRDALAEAGLQRTALLRHAGNFDLASGEAAARHYLQLPARPTAVVCCNDHMAVSFMKHVQAAGVRIPEDLAVVGFDGLDISDYCSPPLTTAAQPFQAIGRAGAGLLAGICSGSTDDVPMQTVIQSTLVLRESTRALSSAR